MPTLRLGLLFLPGTDPEAPVAHVFLRAAIPHGYRDLSPDQTLLTPPARTLAELDYQVTELHEELEAVRDEARRKFEGLME